MIDYTKRTKRTQPTTKPIRRDRSHRGLSPAPVTPAPVRKVGTLTRDHPETTIARIAL